MPAAYPAAVVALGKTGFHNTNDLGTSTCPGGATAAALSITIADAGNLTAWPAANFVIYAPTTNELIFVTSRAGNVLTIAAVGDRGFGGTAAQAIAAGAEVRVVMASEFLQQVASEVIAVETALGVNLLSVLPSVLSGGISIATRQKLNFIGGTVVDNPGQNRVDITLGLTGGGAAGQAAFWSGASALAGDAAFLWDNVNKRLSIGGAGTAPFNVTAVAGPGSIVQSLRLLHPSLAQLGNGTGLVVQDQSQNLGSIWAVSTAADSSTADWVFGLNPNVFAGEKMRLTSGGLLGIGLTPKLPLHVRGVVNPPATIGTVPTGVAVFDVGPGQTNALYFGSIATNPFGVWLQGSDIGDLSLKYPIILNPNGGGVGIGVAAPDASSALRVDSTTGAFLPPRMTTTQRDALTAINGMLIYNTTTDALNYRKAGVWTAI